jgi:hypothetical protein
VEHLPDVLPVEHMPDAQAVVAPGPVAPAAAPPPPPDPATDVLSPVFGSLG